LFADVSSALIGLKLVVRGEENLWLRRPAVFVFNHQSKADVVIMARLLRRDITGVGKKEIKNIPIIGKTMELAGTVFIDRANAASAIEAMQPLVDALRNEGKSVVIAPEGTRSVSPRLAPFKKGAFHLAMQAGVPMVPIVIHNAGDVAPKGDFVFRPATVEVDVLPPVDTGEWRADTIERHVAEVRQMFQATLGQADAEDQAPSMPAPEAMPEPRTQAPAAPERAAAAVTAGKPVAGRPPLKKKLRKKKALKKATPATTAGAAAQKTPRKKPYKKKVGVKSLAGKAKATKAMKGDAKKNAGA
jgi:putative phosphoserine phosphatase/1-acylglycerol-3-phosphate O-acyltransferase